MDFENVTVAGSGVLGSQIAFQTSFHGYNVNVYDINDDVLERAKERFIGLKDIYADYFKDEKRAEEALGRIKYSSDLRDAVKEADLVIEAIPEVIEIKKEFYEKLGNVAPEKTIFATNSSTLLPSAFAQSTGRPEKFIALHFANQIWAKNTAEVMGHAKTGEGIAELLIDFSRSIGMIPLHVKKEQPGYILNSLLVPFLSAGQALWATGVADPETIDKTWMLATGAPMGPFAILDIVGIETAYNIVLTQAKSDPTKQPLADIFKKEFIDKGKLGQASGEGFYKYPHPSYLDDSFLKE